MEVQHNGTWGLVCVYGWDLNDVQVVCSQLGLGRAIAPGRSSLYGQDLTRVWLNYVNCVGTEKTIESCSHAGWRYHFCYFGATIRCSSGKLHNVRSCVYLSLICLKII